MDWAEHGMEVVGGLPDGPVEVELRVDMRRVDDVLALTAVVADVAADLADAGFHLEAGRLLAALDDLDDDGPDDAS